ncbi:efflux RND transporter periplasmic adaptor subunit [Sphingomonas hylomeconis]|uniref:Efflux RND transporter periplasmic adaptor subunit n=1 Tax=Sphingomonas hylomeconis TaxID=1395958 RepID=A0ABV7STY2_9SPHN|nr:HlyD family efflux transporter periplasmic adaptor subunit [Sphingomonas hylomeconis]
MTPRPPAWIARPVIAWSALALLLLAVLGWWWPRDGNDAAAPPADHSLVVQRQPFSATLTFAGKLAAGEAVSVTAPFDGTVRTVQFDVGRHVNAGDALLVLDTEEIETARNTAEAAWLKARQPAIAIARWAHGPEVGAARRRARLAAVDLARLEREARESRRLLARGLIARNEQDSVEQQLAAQRMTVAGANDDLAETLARGGPDAARIARLELANAGAALRRSVTAIGRALVRAPVSGIVQAPPVATVPPGQDPLRPGAHVARSQRLGTIARDGALAATFEVDEADVNTLAIGQPVTVTGPGFADVALTGTVATIVAAGDAGAGPTRFIATARLRPPATGAAMRARIGMTAAVTVLTYQQPAAIVIPAAAVRGSAPVAHVTVRSAGRPVERQVRVGRVTPGGVEIRGGLRPGETLVWTDAPVPAATAAD